MYKITANISPSKDYVISVHRDGECVEEYFSIDEDTARWLAIACSSIIDGVTVRNSNGRMSLDFYRNAYQLIVNIAEGYVRAYFLTKTELKLFQASLRRAIDG